MDFSCIGPAVLVRGRLARREVRVKWKTWRHRVTQGLGDFDLYVCKDGLVIQWYAKRTGVLIRSLWVPWRGDLGQQWECVYQGLDEVMKRRAKPGADQPRPAHADGGELLERWPTLAGWFTDPTFDDGEPRSGGWAGLSARDGLWVCLLKDAAQGLHTTVTAPTLLGLLDLVEHVLLDPGASWRIDLGHGQPKPRKKK